MLYENMSEGHLAGEEFYSRGWVDRMVFSLSSESVTYFTSAGTVNPSSNPSFPRFQ